MAIGKKLDPSKERNSRYAFDNKFQDIARDYRKERLSSKTLANMEDNSFTTDDNNEIYVIPNDTNLNLEYITMEYCEGILLFHYTSFSYWFGWSIDNLEWSGSFINNLQWISLYADFKVSNLIYIMRRFLSILLKNLYQWF